MHYGRILLVQEVQDRAHLLSQRNNLGGRERSLRSLIILSQCFSLHMLQDNIHAPSFEEHIEQSTIAGCDSCEIELSIFEISSRFNHYV